MNTFKKITLTSAVAFALFTFNACGDDSNSTSASGENSALSSAVEDEESSSSINDDSSSSVIPGSSSSVIPSDSEGSSSSVKGSVPADVSSSSVIPDPDRESSSSSVNSSSSVKSSSSSSAKSSSSVASSSSGEYVPFDHSKPLLADSIHSGAYKIYEDSRDGQKYYYLTINGKRKDGTRGSVTIFAQNLNYGVQIDGTENQNDDNKVEKYCYENDWIRCDEYGGLYQWAETMGLPSECNTKSCANLISNPSNHQGICPDGWRLMTYDDYELIYWSTDKGALGIRSQYTFKGSNYTGFSLVGAGYRCSGCSKGFEGRLGIAGWYYPTEIDKNKKLSTSEEFDRSNVFASVGYSYDNKDDHTPNTARSDSKLWGFSIRCVKVE